MSTINFETKVVKVGPQVIIKFPASAKLPSKGIVLVRGTMNGSPLETVLEPDGKGGHWFKVEKGMGLKVGDVAKLAVEPSNDWPEPVVPADVQSVLDADPDAKEVWGDITPLSRWDWIRWVRGTKNPETRKKRIVVMCSKLTNGKRRACCFNRSECTDPEVSQSGVLMAPTV